MLENHENVMDRLKQECQHIWYLEVLAVHPSLQGQRLGAGAMESLLEIVGTDAILLECTSASNVGFYKKFGFEVIEEVVLSDNPHDGSASCPTWVMLKHACDKQM